MFLRFFCVTNLEQSSDQPNGEVTNDCNIPYEILLTRIGTPLKAQAKNVVENGHLHTIF